MFNNFQIQLPIIDGRYFQHREITYSPTDLRQVRKNVYILTTNPEIMQHDFVSETDGLITSLCDFSDTQIANSAFYVYARVADLALPWLRRIVDCKGIFAPPPFFGKQPYYLINEHVVTSFNQTGEALNNDPFGDVELHSQICQAVELTKDVVGDFVEIGVYSGSSALTALHHMKNINVSRRSWLIDTYSGFIYTEAKNSADIIWSGTHLMDKMPTIQNIRSLTSKFSDVNIIPMNICEGKLPDKIQHIALANIDVDLYEAVLAALVKVAPKMSYRGIMIVEDPTSCPGLYGAYLAMHEFLATSIGRDFVAVRTTTQYFLIRVR